MASLRHTIVWVVLAVAIHGRAAPMAFAQTPESAPASPEVAPPSEAPRSESAIDPPRLIEARAPEYPQGHTEAVTVVFTLLVDAGGGVRELRAIDGHPDFVEAARSVVTTFRFEPARRGGVPIAAIVRVGVDFTPPTPPDPESTVSPPPTPPPPMEEIVVRGARTAPPPQSASLGRADIRQLPGAMGDPLRSVEVLPGVTPTISGLPYFYVRGAPPSATGYYLDDIPLPYLFHVGLGPSILHPGFVRSVGLESAGGHPRYGRAAGAFVVATTNPPSADHTWEGRVRVIDSSAFVAAPFADGRGHAAVGTTFSYTKMLLNALAPQYTIDYRDYAVRVGYDVGRRDRVTLFSLGAYDFASELVSGERQVLFAAEVYRFDLRWDRDLGGGSALRAGLTWGYDRTRLTGKRFASDEMVAARVAAIHPIGRELEIESGADVRRDDYDADLPSEHALTRADYEETKRIFAQHVDTVTGAFAAMKWRPLGRQARGRATAESTANAVTPNLELVGGLRFDAYTSRGRTLPALEPRTSLAYEPTARLRFSTAHGYAHQTPAYSIPLPAVSIPGMPGGLQRSLQSSVSGEVKGPFDVVGGVTLFRGVFANLSDFVLIQSDFPLKRNPPLRGEANGVELSLRRPIRGAWGAQVSYTLSRSTREEDRRSSRLSSYDRPHVLNVALLFALGRGWTAGVRTLLYSGLLRDPESGSTERLPAFFRLDARIAKRWKWGKTGYVGVVVEALNATLSRETVAIRCEDQTCTPRVIGPLTLPSVGIEGGM